MSKKKKIAIAFLLILLAGLAGAGGGAYWYYDKYIDIEEVYPGISIGGMDLGGLSQEEARKKVGDYVNGVKGQMITLQAGEKESSFAASEIGLDMSNPEVVDEACNLGRSGNIIDRFKTVYGLTRNSVDYPIHFSYDETIAREKILTVEKSFLAKKKDATIKRKNGKFIITDEVNGLDMDLEKNADQVINSLSQGNWEKGSMTFSLEYTEDKAKHTRAEYSVIKDKLGTFTTSYAGSSDGRCTNVENGCAHINGTILYPGDSFSVHDAVTPFTKDNGYRLAGSYENGTTVQTYGGGICQVSTTLYNAVLRAELEVLERNNHSMTVHYVDLSEDAAISGDQKDFRFKNNLEYPIYIVGATHDDHTITFTIYGKEYRSKDRSIEFVSETTGTYPPHTETVKDKSMKAGKKVVEKSGHTGYTARLWKVIHEKGKDDVREQVNTSSYMSTPTVVRVGTKKEQKKKDKKKDKEKKGADQGKKKK